MKPLFPSYFLWISPLCWSSETMYCILWVNNRRALCNEVMVYLQAEIASKYDWDWSIVSEGQWGGWEGGSVVLGDLHDSTHVPI